MRVARNTISELLGKPQPAARDAAAQPEAGAIGRAKSGLMAQLFGKK